MVRQIAHRYPRMKVLEVSAGTGGATQHALAALQDNLFSSTFTDVSSSFFEKAQERFQESATRVVFKTFELEKNPKEQGYQDRSFDLIVGSLVVHATKSLETTLSYIRSLLKPGGYIVLVEGSVDTLRSGFMMAGLPGWWVGGEDRRWGPKVSSAEWDRLLRNNGFSGVDAIARDSDIPYTNLGVVFVSQVVDDLVNLLRSPLDCFKLELAVDEIVLVGGSLNKIQPLTDNISNVLRPWARKQKTVQSIDLLESTEIPSGGAVLCLTELDDPIFKSLTDAELGGLQNIFAQAERILFVTCSDSLNSPYSIVLLGLVRSLRLEIPHLKIQPSA